MAPTTRLLPLATALVVSLTSVAAGAEEALWVRTPALSPDGTRIAFSYGGDLWVVPADGGRARRLTSHVGHELGPVWSPDSTRIAFAADWHGNDDVFVVGANGGAARRLTHHSDGDRPTCFSRDGRSVLFTGRRHDDPDAVLPSAFLPELYRVGVDGGRVERVLTTPAEEAVLSPDGSRLAYHDLKGYEDPWRKHHVSPVARDVWVVDLGTGRHTQLTDFGGEDRNPVWSPDGATLHFLSERGGSSNVWRLPAGGGDAEQVTTHELHPVRFLSTADDGTLCYAHHGIVHTLAPGGAPRRVSIEVTTDHRENPTTPTTLRDGATEMAPSADGKFVAFVVRGEVFVASAKYGTTRRITHTPEQERSVTWSPDGTTLYYASERGTSWDLYRTRVLDGRPERFADEALLGEEPVLVAEGEQFQPLASPDGKHLAYLHDRDELRVLELETGQTATVVPARRNYSYADGDVRFDWSPDGRWLAFSFLPRGRWIDDVGIARLPQWPHEPGSTELIDVTQSGYHESAPHWSRDGRSLLFYSARYGRRNHGSWGSDGDVLAFELTRAAWDRSQLDRERLELLEGDDDSESRNGKDGEDEAQEQAAKEPPVVEVEPDGRERRIRRLTPHSAPLGDFVMADDGEALVYLAQVSGKWDVWLSRPRDRTHRKLVELGDDSDGDLALADDGKLLFVRRGNGRVQRVELKGALDKEGGPAKSEPVAYAAELAIDGPGERRYVFDHAWRQVRAKFYDPELHGVDWKRLRAEYAPLLEHVHDGRGFAELLSELLGELNASHTGARYRPQREDADATAGLGLLLEPVPGAEGFRVEEVLPGGPADRADSTLAAGATLLALDGVRLTPDVNLSEQLDRKAGKPVRVEFRRADGTQASEVLRAVSLGAERNLLHERWLRTRRELTHRLSGGRVGYVHVRGMNDSSFRRVYREVLGQEGDREALVVDTRFNGGGWLHDDLVTFLGGDDYNWFVPRGKQRGWFGAEPLARWSRPVAVVQSESNYSDAHIFPYAFQRLGIGKLVGTPVAGTGTAVWWERQIDPALVFGIPQVGMQDEDGNYLENQTLEPDVLVLLHPEEAARGEDPQLAAAVEVLLGELDD